jgi:hypothetical protein
LFATTPLRRNVDRLWPAVLVVATAGATLLG